MASSSECISRFCRYVALDDKPRNARVIVPANDRLTYDLRSQYASRGDVIYSYGRHFPLVRYVAPRGNRPGLFVMNGDRWTGSRSTATHRHQTETRAAVAEVIALAEKRGKKIESILIPFSALEGARIDIESIRPIHVREDRTEKIERSSRYLQDVPRWMQTKTEYTERTGSVEFMKKNGAPGYSRASFGGSRFHSYVELSGNRYFNVNDGEIQTDREGNRVRVTFPDNPRDGYGMPEGMVWASWTLLGDENGNVTVRIPKEVPAITPDENGIYRWTEDRHWLGDSLFTADVIRTDHTDIVTRSRRVADASGGHLGYRSSNIGERYVIGHDVKTVTTRYRFLSSFDYNEPRALYFLAALPRSSRAETVEQAYADLMPASVARAIENGTDVIRQGDIYAVATSLTKDEVYARAVRRSRRSVANGNGAARPGEVAADSARATVQIFGTAHTATEVAVTADGVTYVRGTMYHDPSRFDWRGNVQRDHVSRKLGDGATWYVCIRNTVPRLRENRSTEKMVTEQEYFSNDNATETATV